AGAARLACEKYEKGDDSAESRLAMRKAVDQLNAAKTFFILNKWLLSPAVVGICSDINDEIAAFLRNIVAGRSSGPLSEKEFVQAVGPRFESLAAQISDELSPKTITELRSASRSRRAAACVSCTNIPA